MVKLKIPFRLKGCPSFSTSSSTALVPMRMVTISQMQKAAIGIMTELVRKSEKSRNCMPMILINPRGP